jgi:FAD/FMN-containing dehydrogenase
MAHVLKRRGFLAAVSAGAAVLGFDPVRRSWVTEAAAATLTGIPPLDGTLFVDAAHLAVAADDFGHIISRTPVAVLLPGSAQDIVKMVRFARAHGLKIAAKGQGHSQFGQAQARGGIIVDSSSLATIHSISSGSGHGPFFADVDAGVMWASLFDAAESRGLTPPVLTDYMELAVGGTLSVGGIGGATQHFGIQADNVVEMTVVTGRGDLVTCSPSIRPDLFEAVRAGLGQVAIIVRATVRLNRAKQQARVFHLFYDDIHVYVQDQLRLLAEGRFDYLEGQVVPKGEGTGWRFMIEAASYFDSGTPNETALLRGLRDSRSEAEIFTQTYSDFAFRLEPTIEFLKSIGVWTLPHPWLSLWVGASQVSDYVGGRLETLTLADTGQGPILLYPVKTSRIDPTLFRLPREPVAFAFNILRTSTGEPSVTQAMLDSNRDYYDELVARGGTRYGAGAIPFTPADWVRHFGPAYPFLLFSKRKYDPDNVLAPGQGIFGTP